MRHFLFIWISLLFGSFCTSAQDTLKPKTRTNFISTSIGGSFAEGNYATSKSNAEGSGFATSGFQFQFEYAFFWTKNTGLGFVYGSFSNGINQNSFKSDLIASTPVPFGSTMKVSEVGPWNTKYIMLGPYITLPLKNIMIDFKALGGLMITRSPEFTYTISSGSTVNAPAIQTVTNTSFGFLLGTNLRMNLSKTTQFKFGLDFMHTNVDTGYRYDPYTTINRGTQSISVFNLSWGLAFRIGKSR